MDELLRAAQWVVRRALTTIEALATIEALHYRAGYNDLRRELGLVQEALGTAKCKQIGGQDMEQLLEKLRDLVRDASNLLDQLRLHHGAAFAAGHAHHAGKAFTSTSTSTSTSTNTSRCRCMPKGVQLLPCSSSPHVDDHDDDSGQPGVPQREHAYQAQMSSISERRIGHIVEQLQPVREEVTQLLKTCARRALDTHDGDDLIGIENARDMLIHTLCKGEKQLITLSIVGFGGLGKTALAKAVYHKLMMQFDCTAFVHVSRNPSMKKVLTDLLCDLNKQNHPDDYILKDLKQLSDELREFLHTKRYLIVIDDLWDEKSWEIISVSLPINDCGSRVITTTRANAIAKYCIWESKGLTYGIMPLGYQNSKRLFLKRCFGSEDSCHDAVTEVDEILKICGGMPSAIISIASAIFPSSAGKIKEQCLKMIKSLHSAPGDLHCVEELTMSLSYSYFDLPHTLRACLLYLAASTKNQRIQKDNLVRKWIAEGLIPEGNFRREEVAGHYLHELINRNVIQPVKHVNCNGKETYEVTYMMLYVLRLISREENFATFFSESERHVEVMPNRLFMQCSDSELVISTERVNLTNVCSVTMLGPANPVSFKQLKKVQVLDLDGCQDLDNSDMDDICRMIKLKYLSLKQTQVTEIPPEISNLRNLETLDVSWTQISNLPPEIWKLQNLETLNVRRTQISNVPPEISNLQNLVTLDVRQTQVKELPTELLALTSISHLHFGQSGCSGVKLPLRIHKLNRSVQVMGTVDSRECLVGAMMYSRLHNLGELKVVLYDGPADIEKNDELLSSVAKCINLKSLTIYGDSNPSHKLIFELPAFPRLKKLKVAGRFVKVPGWIAQLHTLTLLVIRVCKLEENDLVIIGGLPCLSVLELALVALPRKQVTITSGTGFAELEVFCFDCRVPWVRFQEKAMPNMEHLQLKLYSGPGDKLPSGIRLLERLNMVTLLYSSQYAASVGVTKTVSVVREDAASHANLIELSVNGNQEIFPPNKSADRGASGEEFDTSVDTGPEIV